MIFENYKQLLSRKIWEIFWISNNIIEENIVRPIDIKYWDISFIWIWIAKNLKISIKQIYDKIKENINELFIFKIENVWPYINFFVDKNIFVKNILNNDYFSFNFDSKKKVCVEFLSANPNKALHIWQARNICIWDSISNIYRFLWFDVENINYWDDSWVNVWFNILWHVEYWFPVETDIKYDHYCWKIYTTMRQKEWVEWFKEKLSKMLLKIEHKNDEKVNNLHYEYTRKCMKWQLDTCLKLWISFDLINRETDILSLDFFKFAFEKLKKEWKIKFSEDWESKWCWIIDLQWLKEFENLDKQYQIIIKSDWVVTYVWKDIAYSFWKLWYLWKDFFYEKFADFQWWKTTYTTSSIPNKNSNTKFWNYNIAISVVDNRQTFAQNVVKWALEILWYTNENRKYFHVAYWVVYLTPKSLKMLWYNLSQEDENKSRLPFSSRKWWEITIDDALNFLYEKAKLETKQRNENIQDEQLKDISKKIAIWAFRYFLIMSDLNKDIVFDIENVLKMEWETGPYIMYSYARFKNIISKSWIELYTIDLQINYENLINDDEYIILTKIDEFDFVILKSLNPYSPNLIAKYIFELCQILNNYYWKSNILKQDENIKIAKLKMINKSLEILKKWMELIWIPILEKM